MTPLSKTKKDILFSYHNRGYDVAMQQVDHVHCSLHAPPWAVGKHVSLWGDTRSLEASNFDFQCSGWKLQQLGWNLAQPEQM